MSYLSILPLIRKLRVVYRNHLSSCGRLTAHVFSLQENESTKARQPDVLDTMRQMADRNSNLLKKSSSPRASGKRTKVSGNVVSSAIRVCDNGSFAFRCSLALLELSEYICYINFCSCQMFCKSIVSVELKTTQMLPLEFRNLFCKEA